MSKLWSCCIPAYHLLASPFTSSCFDALNVAKQFLYATSHLFLPSQCFQLRVVDQGEGLQGEGNDSWQWAEARTALTQTALITSRALQPSIKQLILTGLEHVPSNFFFFFFFFCMMPYGMEYPCDLLRAAVLVLSPSSSPCLPSPSLAGQWGKLRSKTSLALCSTAQQQLKHECFIDIVFLLKPEHIIIPDITKKVNSVPAETSTMCLL